MPNFFDKYPYTDFHELNLDWIIKTVKETVAEWAVTLTEWHNTQEEWHQLYQYVHDYFDNLDVQQEINNKLDEMASDGTLATIAQPFIDAKVADLLPAEVSDQLSTVVSAQIGPVVADQIGPVVSDQVAPYISPAVNDWLDDNVTPGAMAVVDRSLTISGAGADALVTGDMLRSLNKCFNDSYNLFNPDDIEVGLLRTTDGTIITTYTAYRTTGFIPVEYNDEVRFQFNLVVNNKRYDLANTSALTFTNVCYYDADKNYISGSGSTISTYLTVSESTAKYIRISTNGYEDLYDLLICVSTHGSLLMPYVPYDTKMLKYKNGSYKPSLYQYKITRTLTTLPVFFNDIVSSAKSYILSARVNFSIFTDITIGLDASGTSIVEAKVDNSNVTITDYRFGGATIQTYTYPHGLNIQDEIFVSITGLNTGHGKICVTSNGSTYNSPELNFVRHYMGTPFIKGNLTVTEGAFTFCLPKANKNIWLFGDSYLQQSTTRWIYYMDQNEVDTYMTDANSGENSAEAFSSLITSLRYGKPKYLVWTLGMNDGTDSGGIPNTTWMSYASMIEHICTSLGIELIYGTVPTVPTINNEHKNSYIRSSGYRYIDFAKSVGAQADGTWYAGMLSDDNVHPTEKGGLALYTAAASEFPEFFIK